MFAKNSRYRKLPDDVVLDAKGRRLSSKALRPLPEIEGVVVHTIQQGERLDHLAQKYYRQSRKWWRICDANSEFLSPLALLGQEPLETTHFELTCLGDEPQWTELLRDIEAKTGIVAARLGETHHLPEERYLEGDRLCTIQTSFMPSTDYQGLIPSSWQWLLQANGIKLDPQALMMGDGNRWRILDRNTKDEWKTIYLVQAERRAASFGSPTGPPSLISVHVLAALHEFRWDLVVMFNRMNISAEVIADIIAKHDFTEPQWRTETRLGKPLRIPPDSLR